MFGGGKGGRPSAGASTSAGADGGASTGECLRTTCAGPRATVGNPCVEESAASRRMPGLPCGPSCARLELRGPTEKFGGDDRREEWQRRSRRVVRGGTTKRGHRRSRCVSPY